MLKQILIGQTLYRVFASYLSRCMGWCVIVSTEREIQLLKFRWKDLVRILRASLHMSNHIWFCYSIPRLMIAVKYATTWPAGIALLCVNGITFRECPFVSWYWSCLLFLSPSWNNYYVIHSRSHTILIGTAPWGLHVMVMELRSDIKISSGMHFTSGRKSRCQ